MATPVTATQVRPPIGTCGEPGSTVTRDREGLLAILDDIDRAGWNCPVADELLAYVRATVVRPNVAATGLTGPAADQAEATAWEATWEALALPSLRSARSPWGVLWTTARRAALGELVAGIYCTDVRAGWRLARPDAADSAASDRVADNRDDFRHDPPASLADLEGRGIGLPASPQSTGIESSDLLSIVVRALVEVGWRERPASEIVDAVSGGSVADSRTRSGARGWRHLAEVLDVPPWQVRRVTVVMLGGQDWPGLVERLIADGPRVLADPCMRAALRSTVIPWWPSPPTAARRAGETTSPSRSQAA